MYQVLPLDSDQRAREKAVARRVDARALAEGHASANEIAQRNDFFAALDVENFRIRAIGRRKLVAAG